MLLGHRPPGVSDVSMPPQASSTANATVTRGRQILETLLAGYHGRVAVKLWDDSLVCGRIDAEGALIFTCPAALRELILHPDLMRMAENYLDGAIDVRGPMEAAFDLVDFLEERDFGGLQRTRLLAHALRLPAARRERSRWRQAVPARPRANGAATIRHHYDVSNDFYHRWLDPEMVYSCAYFSDTEQALADAQRDKLEHICRKLRLRPGHRVLDIGCGWGALAVWAARRHGAQVHGITLSEQQCEYARTRVREAGLEDRVHIELRDYRALPADARYDRIVSAGMFEHVGLANLPLYFATAKRVLKPGGLFLNHGITNDCGWVGAATQRFINRYVFPDGELTRVSAVEDCMEQAGFEILDVESLRPHYALTLKHWLARFEDHSEELVALVGERLYRIWRLYLGGSAHYFRGGRLSVYQIVAGHAYADQPVPLRRDDLYR